MSELKSSEMAMFSHSANGGEWEDITLTEALALVEQGKVYECFDHDYDDGLRSFHCSGPCEACGDDPEDFK